MKINKNNKKVLNEELLSLVESTEDPTVTDTGDTIETDVKVTSTGDDAKPIDAEAALKIENSLTEILDRAYDDAKYALAEDDFNANCNVLVTGLPGSSKTATIRNWARARGCNIYYLDAKNPDLQLLTSGAAAIDKTDPNDPKVNTAYSNALANLDRENSILFLDELNRQIKEYMRGSLLTLIADRRVAGKGEDGFRYFPNLLFTIAAINPAKDGDRGASKLNEAEKRRFYYNAVFNSEVPTTKSFINSFYDQKIAQYVKKHPDLTEEDVKRINSLCLRQWLGLNIVGNRDFHYTTIDEYAGWDEDDQIMCQSKLTELVDHSRGDLDRLRADIKTSGLNKDAKSMLTQIIDSIILPNVDEIRARKAKQLGLDLRADLKLTDVKEPEDPDAFTDDDFLGAEDDSDFAETAGKADTDKVKAAKISDVAALEKLRKVLGL